VLQLTLRVSDYLQVAAGWLGFVLLVAWALVVRSKRSQDSQRGRLAKRVIVRAGVATIVLLAGVHLNRGRPGYNVWDLYHTTVGGKFLPELGYEHLYDCSWQLGVPKERRSSASQVRDLATFKMRPPGQGLTEKQCTELFSPERLREFRRDSSFFLGKEGPLGPQVFMDFGYNGTPFHAGLVRAVFGPATITGRSLYLASMVDSALMAAALVLVFKGFGLGGLAVTVGLIGLNVTDASVSMNASFLRHSYVAALLAATSLLALRRPGVAAILLAIATADRLFPICFAVAYIARAAMDAVRNKRFSSDDLGFAGAFVGALIAIVAFSSVGAGYGSWRQCLVHLWHREHALFVIGVGLKPLFIVPSPLQTDVGQIMEIFTKNGSIDCWWVYYPVAIGVVTLAGYLLLSRLERLPFTLLFGLILVVTLATPLPYYMLILTALGPFCMQLSASNCLRATLWTVGALVLALTVQAVGRIGYMFATAFMSPITLVLLAGLVRISRSEPARALPNLA
jgi:hypothetical protein